jgi:hypothetical protein
MNWLIKKYDQLIIYKKNGERKPKLSTKFAERIKRRRKRSKEIKKRNRTKSVS